MLYVNEFTNQVFKDSDECLKDEVAYRRKMQEQEKKEQEKKEALNKVILSYEEYLKVAGYDKDDIETQMWWFKNLIG